METIAVKRNRLTIPQRFKLMKWLETEGAEGRLESTTLKIRNQARMELGIHVTIPQVTKALRELGMTLSGVNQRKLETEIETRVRGTKMEERLTPQEWAELNAKALADKNREIVAAMVAELQSVDIETEKRHWRRVFAAAAIEGGKSCREAIEIADEMIKLMF